VCNVFRNVDRELRIEAAAMEIDNGRRKTEVEVEVGGGKVEAMDVEKGSRWAVDGQTKLNVGSWNVRVKMLQCFGLWVSQYRGMDG
jgi:hypothetical protein